MTSKLPSDASSIISEPIVSGAPSSLFEGVEAAACAILEVKCLRHRSALHTLCGQNHLPPGAVTAALNMIRRNWERSKRAGVGSVSLENWRWCVPQVSLGAGNRSPEVVLERAIARACVSSERGDWSNQVPVASGVVGPSSERRRAIDLVHQRGNGHYEFIELKIASDTPLYAAFEIIGYVGAWLVSRKALSHNPLLAATQIAARVLAPAAYYAPFNLRSIERALHRELADYGTRHGLALSFGFEVLPHDFEPLVTYDNAQVLALLNRRRPL